MRRNFSFRSDGASGNSVSQTSRLCVELLRGLFQDLVLNVRMKKAQFLLRVTEDPMKEITAKAGSLNFCDFRRMYRRFFGETSNRLLRRPDRTDPVYFSSPATPGSQSDSEGKAAVNASAARIAAKNISIGRVTAAIVVFPIPQPRNRHDPTGGVHSPMHRFTIIMMPN